MKHDPSLALSVYVRERERKKGREKMGSWVARLVRPREEQPGGKGKGGAYERTDGLRYMPSTDPWLVAPSPFVKVARFSCHPTITRDAMHMRRRPMV